MNRILAIGQSLFGLAAAVLLLFVLVSYADPLDRVFNDFVGVTETTEFQITTFQETLTELRFSLQELRDTLPTHIRALSHTIQVANQISASGKAWRTELAGISTVLESASVTCDRLASQLPIEVPSVAFGPKQTITYRLPIFRRTTQRVAGIEIPSVDVDLEAKSIDLPGKVDIKRMQLMKDEKRLLSDTSTRLSSMTVSLRGTSKSLDATTKLISGDLVESLEETIADLQSADQALSSLTDKKLPKIVDSLDSQARQIKDSRTAISDLKYLPLILWIASFSMTLAMSIGGIWKLRSH